MFKNILVPVDWTALSEPAVFAAINFSKLLGSRMILLSVAKPRLFYSTEPGAARDGEEVEAANRALAHESLAKASALATEHGVSCETVIGQSAIVGDEIIDVATRYDCDAIFMATRGRMGVLDTIFRESETQNVLRKATIPVFVIPPADRG